MSDTMERILSSRFGRADGHLLSVYEKEGGYAALKQVLGSGGMSPADVRELVKASCRRTWSPSTSS
jgi:NADH:ubiquinone oxidoreductase subunit F (NADH-binding)